MKKIPIHLQPGLQRYIRFGTQTGGFLRACLENNEKLARVRAVGAARLAIPDIFEFLENRVPAECWGSPEKVEAWIAKGGEEGRNAD